MRNLQNTRGSTLPLVIILLAVLIISSTGALTTMRTNAQLLAYTDYNSQTNQLSKSGTLAYTHFIVNNPTLVASLIDEDVEITVNTPPANFAPVHMLSITGTEVTAGVYSGLTIHSNLSYKTATDTLGLYLRNMTVTSLQDIFTKAVYANSNLHLSGLGALEGDVQTAGSITVPGFYTGTATANTPIPLPAFNIYTPQTAGLVDDIYTSIGGAIVVNTPTITRTGNQTINADVTVLRAIDSGNNRTINFGTSSTGRETFLIVDRLEIDNGTVMNIGFVGRTEDITIICNRLAVTGHINVRSHVNIFVIGDNNDSTIDFNLQANADLTTLRDSSGEMIPDLLNIYLGNSDGVNISNKPSVNIQARVDIAGYIYGPTARIALNSGNVAVYGSLIADRVTANNNSEIYFRTPDDAYTPDNISQIFNQSTYLQDRYVD